MIANFRISPRIKVERTSPLQSESGVSILEFALIGPIALILLGVVFDFGMSFFDHSSNTHAISVGTRNSAARMNMINTGTCVDIQTFVCAQINSINAQFSAPSDEIRVSVTAGAAAPNVGPLPGANGPTCLLNATLRFTPRCFFCNMLPVVMTGTGQLSASNIVVLENDALCRAVGTCAETTC